MIPKLTIDEEAVNKLWKEQDLIDKVKEFCTEVAIKDNSLYVYSCDDDFVKMGVFKEYKDIENIDKFWKLGYCDSEDALIKYLQEYKNDPDNSYFIRVSLMDMDYVKYYKNGTYINKDGIDTHDDYYSYIEENPEMEISQDIENNWISFLIYKLKK